MRPHLINFKLVSYWASDKPSMNQGFTCVKGRLKGSRVAAGGRGRGCCTSLAKQSFLLVISEDSSRKSSNGISFPWNFFFTTKALLSYVFHVKCSCIQCTEES